MTEDGIAGVDEAGRGPLAGPVVAAAVILDRQRPIAGLADSKALLPRRREELALIIRERAVAWALGAATVEEIDTLNILHASLLAMRRAVLSLGVTPREAWIDGNRAPRIDCAVKTIIRGDATVASISAASILAKVARDEEMRLLDARYPMYEFARHKGYPTRAHIAALEKYGVTPEHRRSFAPVRRALQAHS